MLYLIHGKDFRKRKQKKDALLTVLRKKRPNSETFLLEPETLEERILDELLYGQGLFEVKHIVVGTGLFSYAETKALFESKISVIAESPNVFIFSEEKLSSKLLGKLEKISEKVFSVGDGTKKNDTRQYTNFALADALGERDKKKLWVLYQKAIRSGGIPEELHGMLFWQIKSIILADGAETPEESGLKPFSFGKAKQFSKNYSPRELQQISGQLVSLYHDAHRGMDDLGEGMERFLLKL